MADVSDTSVTIYDAKNLGSPQVADLKGQGVSFFEWLPDRNLALMALYPAHWKGGRWNVTLARYNPDSPNHESDAPVDDLPKNSKIVGVAYSTATNAVYMKMQVGQGLYRIYRTDANYDTRRIYVQTSDIGKIAVFMMKTDSFMMMRTGGSCILSMEETAAGELFHRRECLGL